MNAEEKAYWAKAKVAIDRALEHRNDAFRAKVLEMTLKNQWGVDDPAFLILLSTGEMRVLMEEHPAQFEALMNRVFKQAESQFLSIHEKGIAALTSSELAAQLTAEGFAVSRTQATDQVSAIAKQMRQVHYWETIAYACGVAGVLASLSWFGGWQMWGLADQNSFWGRCPALEQRPCARVHQGEGQHLQYSYRGAGPSR